jgi:hypothetical protein
VGTTGVKRWVSSRVLRCTRAVTNPCHDEHRVSAAHSARALRLGTAKALTEA